MFVIAILLVVSGSVRDRSEWHEHYATMEACVAAIPTVARSVVYHPSQQGGALVFNCVPEEKGA